MNPNNDLKRATYDAEDKVELRDREAEMGAAFRQGWEPKPGLLARLAASVRGFFRRR